MVNKGSGIRYHEDRRIYGSAELHVLEFKGSGIRYHEDRRIYGSAELHVLELCAPEGLTIRLFELDKEIDDRKDNIWPPPWFQPADY